LNLQVCFKVQKKYVKLFYDFYHLIVFRSCDVVFIDFPNCETEKEYKQIDKNLPMFDP